MPRVMVAGPVTFSGQLVAFNDPTMDNPYQERQIINTAPGGSLSPIAYSDNKVEFQTTGTGNVAIQQYTGI